MSFSTKNFIPNQVIKIKVRSPLNKHNDEGATTTFLNFRIYIPNSGKIASTYFYGFSFSKVFTKSLLFTDCSIHQYFISQILCMRQCESFSSFRQVGTRTYDVIVSRNKFIQQNASTLISPINSWPSVIIIQTKRANKKTVSNQENDPEYFEDQNILE
jgi:hypothetical protein